MRSTAKFRNWVTADGRPGPSGEGGFEAEAGRYHLYVSLACPWAHRTLIFRVLKGLEDLIDVSVVHPDMLGDGWTFSNDYPGATGDRLYGLPFARDIYLKADPQISGRVTVPILWDRKRETIVSNESSEIIRMFNSAFDGLTGNTDDYWPEELRGEIEGGQRLRSTTTSTTGSTSRASPPPRKPMTRRSQRFSPNSNGIEARLSGQRYLAGDRVTEADWRLFTTLVRFDPVYHGHFKCNRRRIVDYPALWAYTRELYPVAGVWRRR